MDDGIPQPPPQHSLSARLAAMAHDGFGGVREWWAERPTIPPARRDWIVAGGVGALIAAGPLATLIGAWLLTGSVTREVSRLQEAAAPRMAAAQSAASDRAALVTMLRRPGLGAIAEALAKVLPVDATVLRAERGRDGLLEIDISTPDPDKLRAALRGEPTLARLRDAGQQRGDLLMTVSFKELAE